MDYGIGGSADIFLLPVAVSAGKGLVSVLLSYINRSKELTIFLEYKSGDSPFLH